MKPKQVKELKDKLREQSVVLKPDYSNGLSTGSTLLNLACTGRPAVGLLCGNYYLWIGDSNSGKTLYSMSLLAEAAINSAFDNHRLIYDDVEYGVSMDVRKMFGKLNDRIEFVHSQWIEDFYFGVDDIVKEGKPFIYILDSVDALSSEDETSKFQEQKTAHGKGKEMPGSYGDGKAKKNSSGIRQLLHGLHETNSILLIINQTRDNVGSFSFEKKTHSGGHALTFYAQIQLWSSVKGKLKRTVNGKPREIGIESQIKVKRNRFTGKGAVVDIPIYWSSGVDDIGSCVSWLIEEKHWSKSGGTVEAGEFKFKGTEEELVKMIEDEGKEKELRLIVSDKWGDIESQCEVSRKNRYQ